MSRAPLLALLATLALSGVFPLVARAAVVRYAVIVGNNRGNDGEVALHHAEADAQRMRDVLRDLGGFEPIHTLLLQGEDADTVRSSLLAMNAQIRQRMSTPGVQVMLFVYYSGHADATSLHMGDSRLLLEDLTRMVQGSSATFRVAVLDACQSGILTRSKGGSFTDPFALVRDSTLPGEGLAFLTASSASENAQESDALQGSFFTHALVSGLMGAADANGDGRVVLDEAYRYAYEATLRATSRTRAGTQHPNYRYDFRGQGDVTLTHPGQQDPRRGRLQLPAGTTTLLLRGDEYGQVVAEVDLSARSRTLSLRPGRYFVRARGRDVLHEGHTVVSAGATTAVELADLERIEYARLVRKGGGERAIAHSVALGSSLRTPLPNADAPCLGALVAYGIDGRQLGARLSVGLCSAESDNGLVRTWSLAPDVSARVYHAWDLGSVALDLGLGGGLTWFRQQLMSMRETPDRDALAPFVSVGAGAAFELGAGFYLGAECDAETHVLRIRQGKGAQSEVALALRTRLMLGRRL